MDMSRWKGALCTAAVLLGSGSSAFAAGKLDEWKKARADIETALRCEVGFIDAELKQIETDPELQSDMTTQNSIKPRLEARREQMAGLGLAGIAADQECNDKLFAALKRTFADRPHSTVEEAETTANSAVANYLLGRWGVYQARLGKANRLRTAMGFLLKDRLSTQRDNLRRPANEFGKDAEVKAAAGSDPVLAYFIGLGTDKTDYIGDAMNDIFNNLDQNNSFTYDGTSYEKLREAMMLSSGYERAIVGQVSPSALEGAATSTKKEGEEVIKVAAATYSIVFFKPLEFTATECAGYVNTGEWRFTDSSLSPVQRCKQMVDVKAKYTLYPVAVDPEFGKLLKPNSSNLNCLLNQKWIAVNAPDKKKLATFGGQSVVATKAGDGTLAWGNTPNQYNQQEGAFLSSCVPLALYDGVGAKRKLKVFLGIPVE